MLRIALVSALVALCAADCYMHMPRGSNNRLNEKSANRNNGNRCFDSQNNNRGGYNVGEIGPVNGFPNDAQATYFNTFQEGYMQGFWMQNGNTGTTVLEGTATPTTAASGDKQTESFYWEKSYMAVTWTVQHGCGDGQNKVYCQMIAQYAVENVKNRPTETRISNSVTATLETLNTATTATLRGSTTGNTRFEMMRRLGLRVMLQNGANTGTPNAQNSLDLGQISNTYRTNVQDRRCQHESNEWYALCRNRDRNKGLFTADQNVNQDRATHTRQNPNGNRRGLECAEERDYYPYWFPSPWVDAAILTDNPAWCKTALAPESQNVKDKFACTDGPGVVTLGSNANLVDSFNQSQCVANGGTWEGFKWNMPAPECLVAPTSQVNHLGNYISNSMQGQQAGGSQAYFMWQLPAYDDLVNVNKVMGLGHTLTGTKSRNLAGAASTATVTRNCVRAIFRLRYNISTTDYDPYNTNASMNDDPSGGIISPVKQNPTVDMGVLNQGLRLAINTAQFGRTFQDRSHTFLICKRPTSIATDEILNLQVQGKRGNIVQTFPATEYQFSPRQFTLCQNGATSFHFQWTGSNTHNNGNPAGDGQAGDAGEGRGGSDRNNLVQMINMQQSYPLAIDKANAPGVQVTNFWEHVNCMQGVTLDAYNSAESQAIAAGTSGFYHSKSYAQAFYADTRASMTRMEELFNNAAASYRGGILCKAKASLPAGTEFAFMCTRNNNFSNRAQKLKVMAAATCSWAQKTTGNGVGSLNPGMMLG